MYYGGHIPREKGKLVNTLKKVLNGGGNCLQIFVGNPYRSIVSNVEEYRSQAKEVREFILEHDMKLFIHSPYILNFAKDPSEDNAYWINSLYNELQIADILGADGCVLHMGKSVKLEEDVAKTFMYNNLSTVIDMMKSNNIESKIYIETAAGQGTELYPTLHSIDPLVEFFDQFSIDQRKFIGFCVDTCHIYAAGYDISSPQLVAEFFHEWKSKIGMQHLGLIHINNSTKELGSRVDRHACLAYGKIPFEGIVAFISQAYKHSVPLILETPAPYEEIQYLSEIAMKSRMVVEKSSKEIQIPPQDGSTVIVFDMGYLLFYRYHATMRNLKFKDKDANPTDAELRDLFKKHLEQQITKTIKKLVPKGAQSLVLFCKDAPRATLWRTTLWPEYKASRGEVAPIIKEMASVMNQVVDEFGVILEGDHLEADDIAALAIREITRHQPQQKVVIIASDRDYLQLLEPSKNISIMDANLKNISGSGCNSTDLWEKIIMGDKSDNIPAICVKCGKKTAERLARDSEERSNFIQMKGCIDAVRRNEQLIRMDMIPEGLVQYFNDKYSFTPISKQT
jgi:deoxyribonuclease-4